MWTGNKVNASAASREGPLGGYVEQLPDAYAKGAESNNAKLLGLPEDALAEARADIAATADMTDIDRAFGKTLDLYGDMVGQQRGWLSDEQYRILIRNRLARNFVAGDYESILSALANMFEATPADIVLDDDPAESGVVKVTKLPFDIINAAGFTAGQADQMIRMLLPVGVRLESGVFEGTFAFAADENEYDEAAGFSDGPDDPTMGGYLGYAIGEDDAPPLPIEESGPPGSIVVWDW